MQYVIKCQKLFIVFTYDATRISFGKDLALDVDSFLDNLVDPILAGHVGQVFLSFLSLM